MLNILSISDKIADLDVGNRIFPAIQDVLTQLLATLVIVFLLAKFLWKPAKKYIDARKNYVSSNIDEATKKNEEAGKLLAVAQERIDNSELEAAEIVKNACGGDFDAEYYAEYLEDKFSKLYNL
jgi:F-type H+-transporting ATPase subunit b